MEIIKPGTRFDFVGIRHFAYGLSCLLILVGIVSLIVKGPKFGIDFAGGTLIQIKADQSVSIGNIKKGLDQVKLEGTAVQQIGAASDNEFLIRAKTPADTEEGFTEQLQTALKTATGAKIEVQRVEMVGPQVGKDLRSKALYALFYAMVFIAIYISGRFEMKWMTSGILAVLITGAVYLFSLFNVSIPFLILLALIITLLMFWQLRLKYAMGAIVALIHDVVITVGILSVFNYEYTLSIVAALLALVGFSLNDTIVVFDRIRENTRRYPRLAMGDIINRSVNETLSRTILTSFTAWMTVICLFFLGGEITRDFAFAMVVGIFIGSYSSIYVASPVLLIFKDAAPSAGAVAVSG
ncbi:MAG: protein translocase subunit SecF [Desulfobacteraceae bacterium]|nr:MAG: protein translocase subunit SecF [Desulfobacteraceae bacterium]